MCSPWSSVLAVSCGTQPVERAGALCDIYMQLAAFLPLLVRPAFSGRPLGGCALLHGAGHHLQCSAQQQHQVKQKLLCLVAIFWTTSKLLRECGKHSFCLLDTCFSQLEAAQSTWCYRKRLLTEQHTASFRRRPLTARLTSSANLCRRRSKRCKL